MTTLTGFYGLRPESPVRHRLGRAVASTNARVLAGTDPRGGHWMIAVLPSTSAGHHHDRGYLAENRSGTRGFLAGRLFGDWPPGDGDRPDAHTLARWLADPTGLPRHAWGRYAGAVVRADGDLVLLRDPLGLASCYHMPCEGGLVFSTRTESLHDAVGTRPVFDWQLIGSFLLQQHFPTTRTSLADVSQLLPGGALRVAAGSAGKPQTTTIWRPVDLARDPTVVDREEVADALRRCTRAWITGSPAVAVELSGGLDSSCVTWAVRRELTSGQRLLARTVYHSGLRSADERRYAAEMARCADAELAVIDAADVSILGPPRRPTRRWDSVSMHPAELRLTEALLDGLGPEVTVLTGGGGDQVFLARAAGSPHLGDHVRARGIRAGLREVLAESRRTGEPLLPLARAAFRGLAPLGSRQSEHPPAGALGVRFPTPSWLSDHFTPLPLALPEGLMALPLAKRQQVTGIAYWAGGADRDHRAADAPVTYPMLSQPLVEIALRTPTHRLVDHRDDRLVLREAVRDALPPVVATRRVKSEYAGLYQWAVRQNLGYLRELVLDGEGVSAGLIDRRRLEADLTRTALGCRPDPNWPLVGLVAAETWCRAWRGP